MSLDHGQPHHLCMVRATADTRSRVPYAPHIAPSPSPQRALAATISRMSLCCTWLPSLAKRGGEQMQRLAIDAAWLTACALVCLCACALVRLCACVLVRLCGRLGALCASQAVARKRAVAAKKAEAEAKKTTVSLYAGGSSAQGQEFEAEILFDEDEPTAQMGLWGECAAAPRLYRRPCRPSALTSQACDRTPFVCVGGGRGPAEGQEATRAHGAAPQEDARARAQGEARRAAQDRAPKGERATRTGHVLKPQYGDLEGGWDHPPMRSDSWKLAWWRVRRRTSSHRTLTTRTSYLLLRTRPIQVYSFGVCPAGWLQEIYLKEWPKCASSGRVQRAHRSRVEKSYIDNA